MTLFSGPALASADHEAWVLQLGYFANLNNALAYQELITEEGFEAQIVATGLSGNQRYQVVSGQADDPVELNDLREAIKQRTGNEGYAVANPFKNATVEEVVEDEVFDQEVFDQPRLRYLLAQAETPQPMNPSPARTAGYSAGLTRTPQEEIDSMPGFTVAGMPIIPTIGLSLGYDDNITAANTNEISSMFYMISPAIRVELPSDHSVLALTAMADIVRYQDSPVDDRDYWSIRGDWIWDISTRQNLGLFAEYGEGADSRGEGRRQGDAGLIPLEPDEWKRFGYGGLWDYGAIGSRGRLSINAGAYDLEYTNNRDGILPGGPGTTALDRDWQYIGGTFFWRVAPKTSLLLDYRYTDMNYKEATDSDSEIHTWMLGVSWDATARTSGRISYGNQKRSFADPTKEDYSGPAWMATVSWRPRTYSMFTLAGTRNTQEPDGNGDYVLRQDLTLSWTHDWATRFGTFVDLGIGEDNYEPDGRSDDLFYWGVGARYTFNQHFRFGGSITGYDRDSEDEEFSYTRLVYMLTLEASF